MRTPNPALMRAYGTHEVFFKKASKGRRVVDAVSEKVAGEFLKKLANPQPGLLESVGLSLGAWMAKEAATPLPRINRLGGIHSPVAAAGLHAPQQKNVPARVPQAGGPKVGPGPVHMDVEYAKAPPKPAGPPASAPVSSGSISGIRPSSMQAPAVGGAATQASPVSPLQTPALKGSPSGRLDASPAATPRGALGTQVSPTAASPKASGVAPTQGMPSSAPMTAPGPLTQGPGAAPGRMKTDMPGALGAPPQVTPAGGKTTVQPGPAGLTAPVAQSPGHLGANTSVTPSTPPSSGSRAKQLSAEEYAAKSREYAAGGGREGKNGTTKAPPGQLTGPQAAPVSGVQAKAPTGPQPQAAPGHLTGPQPQAKAPSATGAQPAAAAPPAAATGQQPASAPAAAPPGTPPAAEASTDASGKKKPFFGWKSKALGLGALASGAYGIKRTFDVAEGLANSGAANSQYGATPGGYYPPQYATN